MLASRISGSASQFDVGQRLEKVQVFIQGLPFLLLTAWLFALKPLFAFVVDVCFGSTDSDADAGSGAGTEHAPEAHRTHVLKSLKAASRRLAGISVVQPIALRFTFAEAVEQDMLRGLKSYAVLDNPEYATPLGKQWRGLGEH
jgi:hypothetical protein